MRKISCILVILLFFNLIIGIQFSYASDLSDITNKMENVSNISVNKGSTIAQTINGVIGIIQIVGTGISLIVITILGIKYMLASPSDKAETKKMIFPILIGCVLLFGAVTLVGAMADFATTFQT